MYWAKSTTGKHTTGVEVRAPTRQRRWRSRTLLSEPLLCLFLLLFIVWSLAGAGLGAARFFTSSCPPGQGLCELDSFSSPAIATAALREESEHLFSAYLSNRELETEAESVADTAHNSGSPEVRQAADHETGTFANQTRKDPRQAATIRALEDMRREVQELKSDLDRKLLAIYSQRGRCLEFVDNYLDLVRNAPEDWLVAEWAAYAVIHSRCCGRFGEVVKALDEVIRTRPTLQTGRSLREVLDTLSTQDPANREPHNP
jgi:hypothetical protein